MRAFVLTVGSRGDVQPFVALAAGLRASGHDAVLAAPAMFGDLAAAHGVPFAPLDLDMSEVGAVLADRHGLSHLARFCQTMGRRAVFSAWRMVPGSMLLAQEMSLSLIVMGMSPLPFCDGCLVVNSQSVRPEGVEPSSRAWRSCW